MIYSNSEFSSYSHGALVVNLDQQVFQQLVANEEAESASSTAMIIDHEGTIISHPDGNLINTNIRSVPYIRRIIEDKARKGDFLDTYDGKKLLISFVKSDRLGWSFVGVSDYDGLTGPALLLQRFIIAITVVFALLGLVAAGVFTNLFYRPISRLIKKVRPYPEDSLNADPIGEYELISRSFDSLENMVAGLQTKLNMHFPQTKKAMLLSMLSGEWGEDPEEDSKWKQLGLRLDEGALRVCVIRLDQYHDFMKQYGRRDALLLKYAISNITEEIVKERMQAETVEDAEDSLTVILSGKESELLCNATEAEQLSREIQRQIQHYLKLGVSIGIGVKVEHYDQIRHSYNTASQAANYRLLYGRGSVLSYENIHRGENRSFEYPLQCERKIMDGLRSGDLPKLAGAFEEFTRHISEFTYDEILLSLHQLAILTLRTSIEMIDDPSEEWKMELQDVQNKLRWHDTIEEIRDWYVNLCSRIVEIRDQKSEGRMATQVKKMLELIEQQYGDAGLNVASIAKAVGLSTNHARKVFKDHTGQSLTNYINEFRFKKARELLADTDLPANRISEMVGFDNPSYFYVSFKKWIGKSPDHYRKTMRIGE